MFKYLSLLFIFLSCSIYANDNVLNLYTWSGDIPDSVVHKFEQETHIKVNYSTYDANETLYAKLLAIKNPGYDIIQPSSYYLTRMRDQGMLLPIDKTQIPNLKYLSQTALHPSYDPNRNYSVPCLWGVTGIFVNKKFYNPANIHSWQDLWNKQYTNQVLLIDDVREVFSISLITLGLSPNTSQPKAIEEAYKNLLKLIPNIKLFATDAVASVIIDDDATIGMAWNGDAFKASQNNPNITFIYPRDGFVAWADDFAIPKGAKHLKNAYKFLNFIERPDINALIIKEEGYPTGNIAAKKYLPNAIKNSNILFPSDTVMKRAIWQGDINDKAIALYGHYWELIKLAG